jgi:hypothetical protein
MVCCPAAAAAAAVLQHGSSFWLLGRAATALLPCGLACVTLAWLAALPAISEAHNRQELCQQQQGLSNLVYAAGSELESNTERTIAPKAVRQDQ